MKTAREIVKALEKAGFEEVGTKGSHKKMRHPDGRWTIVPMHAGDVPMGTVKAIEKQTQVELL